MGTVSLHGDTDIDVLSITISLVARCKSKYTRKTNQSSVTYRGRAEICSQQHTLFQGPNTMRTAHDWNFAFTLPSRCTSHCQDPFKDQLGGFNLDPYQSLPPIFHSENYGFGWSAHCFISYELQAHLTREKTFARDISATRALDFHTTREVECPNPQPQPSQRTITCSSPALKPGHEEIPLTFKDKVKGLYTSKFPEARFKLMMTIPSVVVAGKPCPFFLEVEHDIEGSSAPAPPLIRLKKVSIVLLGRTQIQCIRNEIFRGGDEKRSWGDTTLICSRDYSQKMGEAPLVTEPVDLRELMDVTVPRTCKPSFATFNITRRYEFQVRITVECAQKSFKAEFTNSRVTLLAAAYSSRDDNNRIANDEAGSSSTTGPFIDPETEEVAPAYEPGTRAMPPPTYQDAKNS